MAAFNSAPRRLLEMAAVGEGEAVSVCVCVCVYVCARVCA